jgi:hypothetical protein
MVTDVTIIMDRHVDVMSVLAPGTTRVSIWTLMNYDNCMPIGGYTTVSVTKTCRNLHSQPQHCQQRCQKQQPIVILMVGTQTVAVKDNLMGTAGRM